MPLTTVDQGLLSTNAQYTGFKNRIINGDMQIDQRNNGAEINPAVNNTYSVDRWNTNSTSLNIYRIQQNAGSVTPPPGFTNYLGATTVNTISVSGTNSFALNQRIEGFNVADLAWGTASAQTVTLSFWVRSSLTGTFGGSLGNGSFNRSYPYSYTISAANTWEYKTVTIPGDTTGTWATNNTTGIFLWFGLGVGGTLSGTPGAWAGSDFRSATGAVSVVGTSGATFYITGVQLERGQTATSFDVLPYGTELNLCQRYYYRVKPQSAGRYCLGRIESSTNARGLLPFPTTMRVAPSALDQTGTATDYGIAYAGTGTACSSVPAFDGATTESVARISFTISSGMTQGQVCDLYNVNANGYLGWSAEL